jgi:hypothetical protein
LVSIYDNYPTAAPEKLESFEGLKQMGSIITCFNDTMQETFDDTSVNVR